MNRTPCQYAVLRSRPYAEIGEFVNVGMAVAALEVGDYAFSCDRDSRRRVRPPLPTTWNAAEFLKVQSR